MHRFAALPAALVLASCCLTPASEDADAGPCANCGSRDAGSGDAGTCTGCGSLDAGGTDGGTCRNSSDCGVSAYCRFPTTGWVTSGCPPVIPAGSCHRDCRGGRCGCEDDADCPESAGCLPDGGCGAAELCDPPSCSSPNCSVASLGRGHCTGVCLCTVCPAPDAGSTAGCDGTASLSGGCVSAASFTVATATLSSADGGATIVLSSVPSCQATLPSSTDFEAVVLDIPLATGTYAANGGDNPDAVYFGASYVSWLGDGGSRQYLYDGSLTLNSVDLDAGIVTGSASLRFWLCGSAVLQATFTTEPSACCQ